MIDLQSMVDNRGISIDYVGIQGFSMPVSFALDTFIVNTVAECEAYVSLPEIERGTHMSRFIECIQQFSQRGKLYGSINMLLDNISERLNSRRVRVKLSCPIFIEKSAPVTQKKSIVTYPLIIDAHRGENQLPKICIQISVPFTSLCPCSKAISKYGAHNQRGQGIISILSSGRELEILDLIEIVESSASSAIYPLLKRSDEKSVTEQAYEKPEFVEDILRNCVLKLDQGGMDWKMVKIISYESIHLHNAVAIKYRK